MSVSREGNQGESSTLISTSFFVHFYPFADGGVLFHEGMRRIWVLNASSAFMWCMLDIVSDMDGLARSVAEKFCIDEATALRDAQETVGVFEREGLLGNDDPQNFPDDGSEWDITPHGPPLAEPEAWVVRQQFETPKHVFSFCCADSSLGEAFMRNMAHLVPDRKAAVDTRLAVLPGREAAATWDIYLDGRRYVGGVLPNEVLPYLSTLVFVRACEALNERLLFHAAVLGRGGEAVVFPAEAGSGKSTLAASLAARGYRYLSDELAVLDLDSLKITPLPLPMSLKPGSLEALQRHYPSLALYSVHHRADGKLVRYLLPPKDSLFTEKDGKTRIRALVFPLYRKGEGNRLAVLEKAEALRRLALTGSSNREFTPADVKAMIKVVERNPCYELVFNDLEEAVLLLEKHVLPGCEGEKRSAVLERGKTDGDIVGTR